MLRQSHASMVERLELDAGELVLRESDGYEFRLPTGGAVDEATVSRFNRACGGAHSNL